MLAAKNTLIVRKVVKPSPTISPSALLAALKQHQQKPIQGVVFQETPRMSTHDIEKTVNAINETTHELENVFDQEGEGEDEGYDDDNQQQQQQPHHSIQVVTANQQPSQNTSSRSKAVCHPENPMLVWNKSTEKWVKRRTRRKPGDPPVPRGRPAASNKPPLPSNPPNSTPRQPPAASSATLMNYSFTGGGGGSTQYNPNEDLSSICVLGWLKSGDMIIMEPFPNVYRVAMIVYHEEYAYAEILDMVNSKKYKDAQEWRTCINSEMSNILPIYAPSGTNVNLTMVYDQIFVSKFHSTLRELLNYVQVSKRRIREKKSDVHMTADEVLALSRESQSQYKTHVLMTPPDSLFRNTNTSALVEMNRQLESYRVALCVAMSQSYTAQLQDFAKFKNMAGCPYKLNEWGSIPQLLFNLVQSRPNNHLQSSAELLDNTIQLMINDFQYRNKNMRNPYSNFDSSQIIAPYRQKEYDHIWQLNNNSNNKKHQ